MQDITIGQGETIRQSITVEETGAVSAQFIATNGTANVITGPVQAFSGLTASLTILNTAITPGSYNYYYKIIWSDGSKDYIPNFSNCDDGDCEFPQLIICGVPGVS